MALVKRLGNAPELGSHMVTTVDVPLFPTPFPDRESPDIRVIPPDTHVYCDRKVAVAPGNGKYAVFYRLVGVCTTLNKNPCFFTFLNFCF